MRWIEHDIRLAMALAGGGAMAFALFLLMHALIATHPGATGASTGFNPVGLVTVRHDTPVHPIKRTPPPEPKRVKHPPTATGTAVTRPQPPVRNQIPVTLRGSAPDGRGPVTVAGPEGWSSGPRGAGSSAMTALVRILPQYPPRAAVEGVEGTVRTCFTVLPDGSVADAHVVGASSPRARRLLGAAALVAIAQWKFVPRTRAGHAVATHNICQGIRFRLQDRTGVPAPAGHAPRFPDPAGCGRITGLLPGDPS